MTLEIDPSESVALDVIEERERQIAKGWTREHDDAHGIQHLVSEATSRLHGWGEAPTDAFVRGELLASAALIVAAIEWLDRQQSAAHTNGRSL